MIVVDNLYEPSRANPNAKANAEGDAVCMNCFKLMRSPTSGQSNLLGHAQACYSSVDLATFSLDDSVKPNDRRRGPEAGSQKLSVDRITELNVHFERWITCSGRAAMILDDPELIEAIRALSEGAYDLPGRKTAGVNSELAELDFEGMLAVIIADFEVAKVFYSNQPFMNLANDLWSSKSKIPFCALDLNYTRPWAFQEKDWRRGLTLGLIHMPGRHGGYEIAMCIAQHLFELFGLPSARIVLRLDKYDEETDISAFALSMISDAGGGAPTAARRLGVSKDGCYLHGLDLVQLWGFCIAMKRPSAAQKLVCIFVKKARKLPAMFKSSTQNCEKYEAAARKLIDCVKLVSERIDTLPDGDVAAELEAELESLIVNDDFNAVDIAENGGLLDSDLGAACYDLEWAIPHDGLRVKKLVADVQTRCWSTTAMFSSIFEMRTVNREFCVDKGCEEHDLSLDEYKQLSLILGIMVPIAEAQKFLEAEEYETKSIARPLCLELLQYVRFGPIDCPKLTDPDDFEPRPIDAFTALRRGRSSPLFTRRRC